MAKSAAKLISSTSALSERQARRMRHRRHLHRRRGRGVGLRGKIRARRRRRLAHRHAVLVLRQRDDGHEPARFRKPSGVSTARNVPARFISRRCWPVIRKRDCPRSAFTAATCRTAGDKTIPADVQEKILRFARAGLAVALMRGKSYLGMGGVSMGIAGSIVDQPFFESYLGMRVETIDMTEFLRRMDKGIFDQAEYKKALKWMKENCPEGKDYNSPKTTRPRAQLDSEWEKSVKMALIARDLMVGNPKLAEMGFGEEAHGHNAICVRFPRPAPVDGLPAQRRFPGSDSQHVVRLERHPRALHRRDGKRLSQRRFDVVRPSAHEHRADFCRRADLLESRIPSSALPATNSKARRRAAFCISSIPARRRSTAPASRKSTASRR